MPTLAILAWAGALRPAQAQAPRRSLWSVLPAEQRLQEYAERRFDAAAGLRSSTVFAMQLDPEGIPWIGADDGLYTYAGGTWRREPLPAAFDNQQVRSLLLPPDGSRWVGTRRGLLYRPAGGAWQQFGPAQGLTGTVVFSLAESRAIDGTPRVVAGTSLGVAYFDGRQFVTLPLPPAVKPLGMMVADAVAPEGTAELWVASSFGGVARFTNGRWDTYGPAEGLDSPDVQYVLPVAGPRGGRIFAVGSAGVFVLDREQGRARFESMPGAPRNVYRLDVVSAAGDVPELWVGLTNGQVHRYRNGRWSVLDAGIADRHGTITLLQAVPGHGGGTAVYVSSRSGYLARYSHGVAGALDLSAVGGASVVGAVFAERGAAGRDALWIATSDRGLLHLSAAGRVTRYPIGTGQGEVPAGTIQRTSLGGPTRGALGDSALVLVADSVPWRLAGDRLRPFDEGLGDARVLHLARVTLPDGRHALLAGTSRGVRLWSGTRWAPIWPEIVTPVSAIGSGRVGGRPVVYLGGRHDVRVVSRERVTHETFAAVAMHGVGLGGVRRLCTSDGGAEARLFALDNDYGLLWRPATANRWQPLPASLTRILSNLGITDVACLPNGHLALGTFTGLAVFDVSAPSPARWRVVTQVGDADGLPANGVMSVAPSGSAHQVVWVGTTFGVGVVDLSRAAQLPPARLVVRVVSEPGPRVVGEGEALEPGENDVHVDPMLLTFHREELTRFRVQLTGTSGRATSRTGQPPSGADGEWRDVASRYYHDVSPGTYTLSVWAYDWAGREYGPVHRRFTVRAPVWQTWPARLLYVLCAGALITWLYRWRVRTIRESGLQLLASERRARESEGRFRAIFDRSLDGHLLLEDDTVQAGNAEAARLFGVSSSGALEGRTLQDLLGGANMGGGTAYSGETVLPSAETPVPVHVTITEIPSADRVLRHVVVRDLTAVRKAEAERAWYQAQVREAQKLESLGTLAGGVAHDFNNLLGVIRGNAELARTALRRGRSNDDNLGAILDASDRARDIVRQILTFSRRSTPTREFVNLSRIVLDLQPLLRRMVPRTVHLVIEGAEDARVVMGDPTQLQQLLLNLVSNAEYAMRHTTSGLLTIALSRRVVDAGQPSPVGRTVVLQVRDTGAGMTEAVRSRIFEPFFTTKPTGEGTGLGMAVVHGIVTSHDGRADVHSEPGHGTLFEIRFPEARIPGLWDDDLDPTALLDDELATPRDPVGVLLPDGMEDGAGDVLEESPYAGTSIVVVDDEPAVARVVERALQHFGHVVHVFTRPELALQFIREQPSSVDLLITDQTMPGMTGDLLAERVHALRRDLPVLILTGFSHRLTPARTAAARAHAVMLKPVELAQLKQRVDEALATAARR